MSGKSTVTAAHYAPLLRLLAASGATATPELARLTGRVKSNIRRDMPKLAKAGLVSIDGDTVSLTDMGRQWVHGQDIAEGLVSLPASPSATPTRWPLDAIAPNPLNRKVTTDGIEELAASIIEVGDILQPLILTPANANGVRTILAGERRWTAVRTLAAREPLPVALDAGVPFIEREADDAQALVITLVENSQRRDLTPWEDAQQLFKLAEQTGWTAAEIARRIGRVGEGGKGGIRDVQTKLKIAREASVEAVAEYENTGSWDALRDSVTKPKGPDTPHLRLFLVEAALRAEDETGLWDDTLTIEDGLHWPAAWAKWFAYAPANGHFTLTAASLAWLEGEGMTEGDRAAVLMRHRIACGLPNRTKLRPFVTSQLNWTPPQAFTVSEAPASDEASKAPIPPKIADAAAPDPDQIDLEDVITLATTISPATAPRFYLDPHSRVVPTLFARAHRDPLLTVDSGLNLLPRDRWHIARCIEAALNADPALTTQGAP